MRTIPLQEAVEMIPSGASIMVGGFMGIGTPELIVDELVRQGTGDLTIIANDTASPGVGIGKLVRAGLVRRIIVSHIGLNPETQKLMMDGTIIVDLGPQGTLAERIRA
ncbi:MAG: acetyl-CoA:acetoacetyl-CoA transferase subunit alpha, partial [Hyphomicrobiales bacterium]|nr:acetyl-CoA:acetoacetyl-CoA transferase subunit alpha [Hyphomicrobiales bacterium]